MEKSNCQHCLWGNKCCSDDNCEYYDPLDETEDLDIYIEERRKEFYAEWLIYIAEG